MSTTATRGNDANGIASVNIDMKLEMVVIPVSAAPGSAQGLYLIVSDIQAARDGLVAAGIEVGESYHVGPDGRGGGPDPEHRSDGSYASFRDPDGNGWLLQEVTRRLPGRVDPAVTSFGSAGDLESALRRAAAAYMVAEQAGTELPL